MRRAFKMLLYTRSQRAGRSEKRKKDHHGGGRETMRMPMNHPESGKPHSGSQNDAQNGVLERDLATLSELGEALATASSVDDMKRLAQARGLTLSLKPHAHAGVSSTWLLVEGLGRLRGALSPACPVDSQIQPRAALHFAVLSATLLPEDHPLAGEVQSGLSAEERRLIWEKSCVRSVEAQAPAMVQRSERRVSFYGARHWPSETRSLLPAPLENVSGLSPCSPGQVAHVAGEIRSFIYGPAAYHRGGWQKFG